MRPFNISVYQPRGQNISYKFLAWKITNQKSRFVDEKTTNRSEKFSRNHGLVRFPDEPTQRRSRSSSSSSNNPPALCPDSKRPPCWLRRFHSAKSLNQENLSLVGRVGYLRILYYWGRDEMKVDQEATLVLLGLCYHHICRKRVPILSKIFFSGWWLPAVECQTKRPQVIESHPTTGLHINLIYLFSTPSHLGARSYPKYASVLSETPRCWVLISETFLPTAMLWL